MQMTYGTLYVYADDIISSALTYILIHVDCADGLSHLHKYIWTLYVYADDIISSALTYILIHVDCAYGLSHLHKYIWTLYVYADDIISSALKYTYTCWLYIWIKSSTQVHIKHCMSMQMTLYHMH